MNTLFLLIVLTIGSSCQQKQADRWSQSTEQSVEQITSAKQSKAVTVQQSQSSIEVPEETLADEFADVKNRPKWMDSCLPALYPDTWLDTVLAHPKIARKTTDDGCVLLTIDMIEAQILSGRCERCMEVFNAVVNVSDGYVGEAVGDVAGRLYYNAFETLIKFLADPKHNTDDLLDALKFSFYIEI